jgi:hypothetical protein
LIWYWPAVEQVTGEQVVGALLAYIGGGYETVLWVDDDGRAAAEDRLAGLWTALQAWERLAVDRGEPYPTDPSPLCGWCPFFADCSAGSRFLHEKWAWMCTRDREGRPVPAKVEIDSWGKERRARWDEFVRHG